ncbi:MAG: zinc ribbon domain-containing protein, partial [Desulfomonilaceae bacterium]
MEKSSRKINAKMFLKDFREGKSDDELMRLHSLTPGSLAKLVRLLLDKELLDPSELKSRRAAAPTEPEIRIPPLRPQDISPEEPVHATSRQEHVQSAGSSCPQCGAQVTERMLSCPECGHVLPGEERWEAVEPKKGLFERIPARLMGYIIALPIGIVLFFLFKDVILPMTEATVEKRADAIRQEVPKGKSPMQASKDLAKRAASGVIRVETQRLINDGVISEVKDDYRSFTAGSRWPELSDAEKRKALEDIRTALVRSGMPIHFRLVNDVGES